MIKYVIIGLLLINLLPVWMFKFIPTQDGLNHVYNAYILKEYNNPRYTEYRQVYNLNIYPFPNWISHAFFFVALYFVPPLIAEKLFVTIYMLLMPLSFFYFFHSIERRLWFFGFLGFLYSYNVLFHLGFYNFAISVPLYFFVVGYWWKNKNLSYANGAILNGLLIITYFCHLFSFALLLLSLSLLSTTCALLPYNEPKPVKQRLWLFLRSVVSIIPSYIILLICLLLNPEDNTKSYKLFKELWDFFVSVKSLVYYNDRYIAISWLLLGFICICFILTLFFKIKSLFDKSEQSRLKRFFHQRDGFFILFAVLTVLYFKIPWSYGPPAWLNDRMNLFLFPVLAGWFSFSYHKWLRTGMIVIIVMLSLAHLTLTIHDYNLLNKDMKEFTSGAGLIAENSSISIKTRDMGSDFHFAENHGTIKYLSPFYHDTCFYCLGNGGLYTGNYEPKYAYFPLHYKEGYWKFEYIGIVDYVLTWHIDDNDPEIEKLKKDYTIIHQTKNMKLFQYKEVKNNQ